MGSQPPLDPMQSFVESYLHGTQLRKENLARQAAEENLAFAKEYHQGELRKMKLGERQQSLQDTLNAIKALEGHQGQILDLHSILTTPQAPDAPQATDLSGGTATPSMSPTGQAPTPVGGTVELPHPSIDLSQFSDISPAFAGQSITPMNKTQAMQSAITQMATEARIKALAQAEGEKQARQVTVTPELAKVNPHLQPLVGQQVDREFIPKAPGEDTIKAPVDIMLPNGQKIAAGTEFDKGSADLMKELIQGQTARTTEGMRQAGETGRKKMEIEATMPTPQDVQANYKTTMGGTPYLAMQDYTGKAKQMALRQAVQDGAFPASPKEVEALQQLDTARLNVQSMLQMIEGQLPKDATGRVLGGALSNKLQAYLQSDDVKATFGTLRAPAIQAMRAMAGSSGLRINRAEIEQATENDIPQLTDTVGVARQRLRTVLAVLDNNEAGITGRDKSKLKGAGIVGPNAPTGTPSPAPGTAPKTAEEYLQSISPNQ